MHKNRVTPKTHCIGLAHGLMCSPCSYGPFIISMTDIRALSSSVQFQWIYSTYLLAELLFFGNSYALNGLSEYYRQMLMTVCRMQRKLVAYSLCIRISILVFRTNDWHTGAARELFLITQSEFEWNVKLFQISYKDANEEQMASIRYSPIFNLNTEPTHSVKFAAVGDNLKYDIFKGTGDFVWKPPPILFPAQNITHWQNLNLINKKNM